MKVFWSWQSDSLGKTNRHMIKGAIADAIAMIQQEMDLNEAMRPEIDHDTHQVPGSPDVASTILDKIRQSTAFIADVTPVAASPKGKKVPNPNVMIELGYALGHPGSDRMILVANKAEGFRIEDLPFDLRHKRAPITFNLAESAKPAEIDAAKKALAAELKIAISLILSHAAKQTSAQVIPNGRPSAPGSPSLWDLPNGRLSFRSDGSVVAERTFLMTNKPRAYARIIPVNPPARLPRNDIKKLTSSARIDPLGGWLHGDYGPNAEGYVAVAHGMDTDVLVGCTQFFIDTGELWGITDDVFMRDGKSPPRLVAAHLRKDWSEFLQKSLASLDSLSVKGPYRVELGLDALHGTVLYGSGRQAFDASSVHSEVATKASDIDGVVHEAMVRAMDAYGASWP